MDKPRKPSGKQSDRFPLLTIRDLLEAREAYHVHLAAIPTVVATAIGRFREIQQAVKESSLDPNDWKKREIKRPRTLANSQVTEESWPCVLVFVNRWFSRSELQKKDRWDELVPPRLHLPDGRIIPTCVVLAEEAPSRQDPLTTVNFPDGLLGGGYPILSSVQGEERVASAGCLVSDGDSLFVLTNRHVVGNKLEEGEAREMAAIQRGEWTRIGEASPRQLGKVPFETAYPGWSGRNVVTNLDAGLVRVDDIRQWTSQVYGLGKMGELMNTHPQSLTLDLIGQPVRAFGGVSGVMLGQVHGLFYRYRTVGGRDYVADVLIGQRDQDTPLKTRPGDSGTIWCCEGEKEEDPVRPLALQWGGHRFSANGGENEFQFALGAFLSTVSRELDIEIVPDHNTGYREYWGKLGHFSVAAKATELLKDAKLKAFMRANLDRIAYADSDLLKELPTRKQGELVTDRFWPLSDVADLVWRNTRKKDSANHFADMDEKAKQGNFKNKTLLKLCKESVANLDPAIWGAFYDAVGATAPKNRGALPFRIWQMFDEMVDFVAQGKVAEFLCVAGLMSHYAGDACQPLHVSHLHDGETEEDKGVHSAYETRMLDSNRAEVIAGLNAGLGSWKAKSNLKTGKDAAIATVDLMAATVKRLKPIRVIEVYRSTEGKPKLMWAELKKPTLECLIAGSRNLATLWESAWKQGGGSKIAQSKLKPINTTTLKNLYNRKTFSEARWLDEYVGKL